MSIDDAAEDGYKKQAVSLPEHRFDVFGVRSLLFSIALIPCLALTGLYWSSLTDRLSQLNLSLPSKENLTSIGHAFPLSFGGLRSVECSDGSDSSSFHGDTQYVFQGQDSRLRKGSKTIAVKGQQFPTLIDVTLEDLVDGLESGLFTSVDLVNVC